MPEDPVPGEPVRSVRRLRDPWYLLATGFGSGLAPRAPGTVGTLAALACWWPLSQLNPWLYIVLVVVAGVGGIWICGRVAATLRIKDPGLIVWDEFVGLWLALFLLPAGWIWPLAGFALFRFFDILKPWPVSWLDKNLQGGLGIMMDDIAAGLMALCVLQGAVWLLTVTA
ncbi:MAG: phosphatidylglycerophosphatase A [Pseudomonadales bacterium]|nr:phosphatidylglycerophosphatase A [Pseudomonadales bacterium]